MDAKARAKLKEANELVSDIREAFDELGGPIIWKKQVVNTYDTLYKEVTNPVYIDYEIFGLSLKQVRKEELEEEGLDFRKTMKSYIDASQFSGNDIEPSVEDRVFYKGVLFEVVKINPLIIYDNMIFYTIFFCEATLSSQTEEYIAENEKFFEINNDTYEESRVLYPASILGSIAKEYYVFNNVNNMLKIRADDNSDYILAIDEFDYTGLELVEYFNTKFVAEYNYIEAFLDSGKIGFRTITKGSNSVLNVLYIENLCYNEIGILVGKYVGS